MTKGRAGALRVVASHPSPNPGFPVNDGQVNELHAAFLDESRTRGPKWCSVAGNPGKRAKDGAPDHSLLVQRAGSFLS
jgi:hypothetical protein